jgi:hypothetical protein
MIKENDTTQNIGNKDETKKLRTIKLSRDVNDYDAGEYTHERLPPASLLSS